MERLSFVARESMHLCFNFVEAKLAGTYPLCVNGLIDHPVTHFKAFVVKLFKYHVFYKYPWMSSLFMLYVVTFSLVRHDFCLIISSLSFAQNKMQDKRSSALDYCFPSVIIFCFYFVRCRKGSISDFVSFSLSASEEECFQQNTLYSIILQLSISPQ